MLLDGEGDVRTLVRLLHEREPDRVSLVRMLAGRGWTAARIERVIGRALEDGRVYEDCRHDLQAAPDRTGESARLA
jgi:hypothetical protein